MEENTFAEGHERRFGYGEVYPVSEWEFYYIKIIPSKKCTVLVQSNQSATVLRYLV